MKNVLSGFEKFITVVLLTVLMLLLLVLGACAVLAYGPSTVWQQRFVATFDETSAMKFVPRIFFSEEKVQSILHPTPLEFPEPIEDNFVELTYEDGSQESRVAVVVEPPTAGDEWLEIEDIKGSTFKGKMMVIHDASKVIVGTLDAYGDACEGMYLYDFIERNGAIGGTNAGGFYDPGGYGNGGTPDGLVIRDGAIAWGSLSSHYVNVIGFDADNILHVGDMTGQQALDIHLTSAVSFSPGPVLVKDGKMLTGLGGGMNPRTCIGQTANGTVLLLVLEGRKPDSLGATYDDLAQLMFSYGAVNAANLDGGSSALMYYNGEQITRGSGIIGMRKIPTAILILDGEITDG